MERTALRGSVAALAVAGGLLGIVSAASAQVVQAPKADAATLRADLRSVMAPPNRPLPTDVADLDNMVASQNPKLSERLQTASGPSAITADLNWEQMRVFDGGGFVLAYAYMADLWRSGAATPGPTGEALKQSAVMMFLYSLDLVAVDGVECKDASAPGHRRDQLFSQNRNLIDYIRSLPPPARTQAADISLAVELATVSVRKADPVLCRGGLAEIRQGLAALGGRPLQETPNSPGTYGRTYAVPSAPGYAPEFTAAADWPSRKIEARRQLPAALTRLLATAG